MVGRGTGAGVGLLAACLAVCLLVLLVSNSPRSGPVELYSSFPWPFGWGPSTPPASPHYHPRWHKHPAFPWKPLHPAFPPSPTPEPGTDIPSKEDIQEQLPKWGYAVGEDWGKEYEGWAKCSSGQKQSPVNVKRTYWTSYWETLWAKKYLRDEQPPLKPFVWNVKGKEEKELDKTVEFHTRFGYNGHTIQIPYKGDFVTTEGDDGKPYSLHSIRLHTPSEHTFDGYHYPLEAQFLHASKEGKELVVSAFFSPAVESPNFINNIADAVRAAGDSEAEMIESLEMKVIPFHEIASDVLMQVEMPLDVSGELKHTDNNPIVPETYNARASLYSQPEADQPNYKSYYRYEGSDTQPPCKEGVEWILLKHSLPITRDDLDAIQHLEGHNSRKVQPLNGRLIHDSNVQ